MERWEDEEEKNITEKDLRLLRPLRLRVYFQMAFYGVEPRGETYVTDFIRVSGY